jgi:hypothetical protein
MCARVLVCKLTVNDSLLAANPRLKVLLQRRRCTSLTLCTPLSKVSMTNMFSVQCARVEDTKNPYVHLTSMTNICIFFAAFHPLNRLRVGFLHFLACSVLINMLSVNANLMYSLRRELACTGIYVKIMAAPDSALHTHL